MKRLAAFLRNCSGAAAAEFALILPVALLFLLGIIDVGRYVWTMNELEKAVQMGTRYAVATEVVAEGLRGEDYVGATCPSGALLAGDPICREALGTLRCTQSSCTCPTAPCPTDLGADSDAFGRIVGRMQVTAPQIAAGDVTVSYSGSGVGYAGDPVTADGEGVAIAPIVTVAVSPRFGMRALTALGMNMPLPTFSYSQTLEDGDGSVAY